MSLPRVMTVCIRCGPTGGTFRWTGNDAYVHTPQCDVPQKRRDAARNLWDFTTRHIRTDPSQPIQVNSARELHRQEKEHGVISVAGNYYEQNWSK